MQSLFLDPSIPLVGAEVRIMLKAAHHADIELVLYPAASSENPISLGRTNKEGILLWTPKNTTRGEIRAMLGDVEYVTRIEVLEGHGFTTFVLPCMLATLFLLGISLRSRHRRQGREDA